MKLPAGATSFPIPLYGGRVVMCVQRPVWQELSVLFDDKPYEHIKRTSGLSWHAITKQGRSRYLIGVFDRQETTLVHEVSHTAFQILRYADVRIAPSNDEAYAYLIEALYSRARKAMRELVQRDCAPITA